MGEDKELLKKIDDATKAIQLNPKDAFAYNNRGIAYRILGKHEKAIDDFNKSKSIELNPNDAHAYYYNFKEGMHIVN